MWIQILLFDGFDEVDALGTYEVLHAAVEAGVGLRPELARLDRATVTSGYGLQLHVPARAEPDAPPALLVIPGAGWLLEAELGSWAHRERGRIGTAVAAVHAQGAALAGVGTGITVLGGAGLLRGRAVAYDPRVEGSLHAFDAEPVSERVADDGDIVTSGGMASGLELALWLVERQASGALADELAERLGYGRRAGVWRRSADPPGTS
jgi:transcriptional regulator GlxA family with amidase domain